MSNGTFQVIGDVYDDLVITDYNESYYSSIGQVNREIILKVDPYVNFAEYDNLNGNSPGSDGIVDFIYIIYRNATSSHWYYTGIARLEVSSTINVDGKQIVNNTSIGGGVQQRGGYNGRDYTLYVAAHEMGHYFFGSGHIDYVSNLALMTRRPVWNASRGMHSWERQKLGWINYTNKSTDGSVTMSDYLTADQVYRVPISSTEYFLIENRKKISPHDKAGDTGFYFYRVTGATSFPPTIDVLCADGNWDFSINTSTQTLTRTTPNVNGKDEMNFLEYNNGIKYACYTPIYHENSAWGDDEDAFDLNFNNVLSPVSNPGSINDSLDFTIEVTGTNTIRFYFTNPYAGKPSKPQNLQLSKDANNHPLLTWDANLEPDLNGYRVYKKLIISGGSTNTSYVFTTSTSYTDSDFTIDTKFSTDQAEYWIVAVDNTSKFSVESEHRSTIGESFIQWKIQEDIIDSNINKNSALYQNYPNPFNPTTNIEFHVKEAGFVDLRVYNILGEEITILANKEMAPGKHTMVFNTEHLPSGVYIYKLSVNDFVESKKMILTK